MSKQNLAARALWLARHRPEHVWNAFRAYALFAYADAARRFGVSKLAGVTLGPNVRLQRNRSAMAERPDAAIVIGDNSIIYEDCKLSAYGKGRLEIGADSVIGGLTAVARHKITLGERSLVSWDVFIQDFDAHPIDPSERGKQVRQMVADFKPGKYTGPPLPDEKFSWSFPGDPIEIGADVWIGANTTILKGARIGDGCIVGAGSVVPKGEYPARTIIAGNPARVVREL